VRKLNIISTSLLKLFHGTSDINAKKIKSEGLKSPVESARWYMLSSHIEDAIYHSEKAQGKPVVIEFNIPVEENKRRWEGWPYLWPPSKAGGGSFKGDWYALKEELPPKFIKRIIKVTDEDLRRVKK